MLTAALLLAPLVVVPGADQLYAAPDVHLAVLGEAENAAKFARVFGMGLQVGQRWGAWGAFGRVELSGWQSPTLQEQSELQGAVNVGLGVDLLSVGGRVQTSLVLGPSVLLRGTEGLDSAGEVGVFGELRPAGLRFDLDPMVLSFHPISCAIVVPVLSGIPLVEIQFRTSLSVEFAF